jgi:hypothetical protein
MGSRSTSIDRRKAAVGRGPGQERSKFYRRVIFTNRYGQGEAQTIVENCGNTLILRCSASGTGQLKKVFL